ncbi:MAG: GGDEF domain-containing protein, partial [Burkholderiaceae bacterium]
MSILFLLVGLVLAAMCLKSIVRGRQAIRQVETLASSLQRAEVELARVSQLDPLTNLPNRAHLTAQLNAAIETARLEHGHFAVIFIDLDGLKTINDDYGHHTGDALLATLCARLRSGLRAADCLARLSGDEFVAIAAVNSPDDAAHVCRRMLAMTRLPVQVPDRQILMTASLGVAIYPGDGGDVLSLITAAQTAMRYTK